ncbi:MAG: hypothetical protein GWP19_01490 [Planctomycetia bacterium]|nr:hypothetical protein [Planctomycetia bacterium]
MNEEIINPLDTELDSKWETEVLKDINKSDLFIDYLRQTMGMDMVRYFSASSEETRAQIKGHYSFAKFLRASILRTRNIDKQKKELDKKK